MKKTKSKFGRFLKFIIIVVIIIVIVNSFGKGQESQSSNENSNTSFNEGERISVEIDTLFEDLENNAMVAEQKYNKARIELTGQINSFDSDGKYFLLGSSDDSYMFSSIQCYIDEDQMSDVMKLSKGDIITLNGTIKSIGENMGYSLDVEKILLTD